MTGRTQGEVVAADGTRIAFHSHGGAAGPPVVLTNGIGTTENFWRFLVEDLKRDHRVVHWDYRGHGKSEVSRTGDYRMQAHADDLARVSEAVRAPGGPAPVQIGFSMGVAVVLELYRSRPDLVRGLGLIAGAPDAPGTGTLLYSLVGGVGTLKTAAALVAPAIPVLSPAIKALLRSKRLDPLARAAGVLQPQAPKEDVQQFLDHLGQMDHRAYWATLRGLLEAKGSDVLPTVRVPVSIVEARQDVLMPRSQVRRMREALPQATFVEIDGAGHAGLIEQGPKMVEAMRALLMACERDQPQPPG